MNFFWAELIGTAILILLVNGVVANVVLTRTKGNGSGWIVITFGWGMGVFVGAFCVTKYSGAHLNPAVTIAMAAAGRLKAEMAFRYIGAQMLGAILGAILVWVFYREDYKLTDDANMKLATFSTAPNVRNLAAAFL